MKKFFFSFLIHETNEARFMGKRNEPQPKDKQGMSDNSNHQASEFDFRDYFGETEDNENIAVIEMPCRPKQ